MNTSKTGGPLTAPTLGLVSPTSVFRNKQQHPLNAIFEPKSIAVVGATEKAGSVGRTIPWNLISNPFGGTVFPVNAKRASILGIKAYPSLSALPEQVDLAVIVTPAATVPGIIAECVEAGVKGAIIISAGFKEIGAAGAKMKQQILEHAKDGPDQDRASKLIRTVRQSGRTILTEFESKQLLAAYGIPTVETRVATSESEAVTCAEAIGYPVVLKLFSETITHKTDVGGVQLNLSGADAVRSAYRAIAVAVRNRVGAEHFLGVTVQPMIPLDGYELILGSSVDPQFGPVLLFGSGGQLVEVYRDRALALPPLTTTLARRMMEQTRVFTALQGVRGRPPVDLAALEQLLVRFSYLVAEQRRIKEIDINPLQYAQPWTLRPSLPCSSPTGSSARGWVPNCCVG